MTEAIGISLIRMEKEMGIVLKRVKLENELEEALNRIKSELV